MTREAAHSFLAGGGEMGELISAFDWSRTPVGAMETWSPALRMITGCLLANRFPMLLWWGPQYVSIYNDAYRPILGLKHPKALGQPVSECWEEIWHVLKPLIDTPFNGGAATWIEDLPLELKRRGFDEEAHFTVAYSPVPDDAAPRGIGGVLATVHEITDKVIAERRVAVLRDLGARAAEARAGEEACAISAQILARHDRDIPFALIYLIEGQSARLAGASGIAADVRIGPPAIDLSGAANDSAWPLAAAVSAEAIQVVENLGARFPNVPPGPWADPPHRAVVVPIQSNIQHELAGVLIAGVSARLQLDDAYLGFFELVAAQIATAIANGRAYEQERKRAEAFAEIDRAKTLFFSNVSHEFRTPLTLMMGPLEDALADTDLPARDRAKLDVAHRNSLRLLKLVNSLLDFSRIEAGRAQATYQPTDLAALTADLASNFRSACERAGLKLAVASERLGEPVYVDRDMWEKIVLNLLSNAFKFTFAGEIGVHLRTVDGHAELRVRDTGVGIPPHELPRLFERFHRIEGQRSRTYEGSGIGLALVQELVRLHGGAMRADSAVGRGTSLVVTIPLGRSHLPQDRVGVERVASSTAVRAEAFVEEALRWLPDGAAPAAAPLGPAVAGQAPPPQLKDARILVADDNADMRDYVRELLRGYCDVEVAADGQAALEAIRERLPDLVLSDVMMPRLNGVDLVRAIRSDDRLAELPVVLLSARAEEGAEFGGLDAGADDYLIKPFNARELLARLAANLKLARIRRQANRALQNRTVQFETLINQAPLGIYLVDAAFRIREANPTALSAFGDFPGGVIGRDFDDVVRVVWEKKYADEIVDIFRRTLQTGEPYITPRRAEFRADRKVTEYYEWRVDRITLPDGSFGVVCYFRDISEQVQAENTQQLLLGELNHRVKNTLASVQAIAQQTIRGTRDSRDFAARFSGRIQSLARVHSLLTDSTWRGAGLQELIHDQLLQGPIDEMRLTVSGPAVHLQPQTAVHIALMLHELGTNSVKYGALSAEKGWVTVNWSVTGDILNLQWVERGGPPVAAPTRRGFGTTLIEQSAKSEGGVAEQLFEPEGITWRISLKLAGSDVRQPSEHVRVKTTATQPDQASPRPPARLAGLRVLIIEDESLIALDLADRLDNAGAEVGPAATTEKEALQLIGDGDFDCAVLDANLHGRSVGEIAAALTRRGMPFVFVTGYGRAGLPAPFKDAPVLTKPVSDEQLFAAITAIVANANKTRTGKVARLA